MGLEPCVRLRGHSLRGGAGVSEEASQKQGRGPHANNMVSMIVAPNRRRASHLIFECEVLEHKRCRTLGSADQGDILAKENLPGVYRTFLRTQTSSHSKHLEGALWAAWLRCWCEHLTRPRHFLPPRLKSNLFPENK